MSRSHPQTLPISKLSPEEVRFRDHGLKTIEVVDNGSGISPDDYDSIGRCTLTVVRASSLNGFTFSRFKTLHFQTIFV